MKLLIYLIALSAAAILLLRLLVLSVEPKMTFYPVRGLDRRPSSLGLAYEEFRLASGGSDSIVAWWIPRPSPVAELVFFHGNAGNLSIWLDFLAVLHHQGYSVLAFDYRGYGLSSGSPTEEAVYQDSRAVVEDFWQNRHQPGNKVLYFGRSLGGVTASFAATVRQPDGLVLEATFPDKATLLEHYPVLKLLNAFSRYKLHTSRYLKEVNCPILVIHGDSDRVVPLEVGKKLYESLQSPKEFYLVRGGDHNQQHVAGGEEYWMRLESFVEKLPPTS